MRAPEKAGGIPTLCIGVGSVLIDTNTIKSRTANQPHTAVQRYAGIVRGGGDGSAYNSIKDVMVWPNYPSAPCVQFLAFRWICAIDMARLYPLHCGLSLMHSGRTSKTKTSATKDKFPISKAVVKHLVIAYGKCLHFALNLLRTYIFLYEIDTDAPPIFFPRRAHKLSTVGIAPKRGYRYVN